MLKKDNFVTLKCCYYDEIIEKKRMKKRIVLFYFELANQTKQSFFILIVSVFILDVRTLKARIISIISPK